VLSWAGTTRRRATFAIALALACACGPSGRRTRGQTLRVASIDKTTSCADLATLRVCWDANERTCPFGICVEPLPLPGGPVPSPLGWRCSGMGSERTCVDRQKAVGAFARDGARWVQRHPRMPDDGEWTCSEMGGATVCSGGDAPAGVATNVADAAWFCGTRQGGAARERVCVDFAPDFPDANAHGWTCGYATEPSLVRVCERDPAAHDLGDACSGSEPCLDGVRCVERRCVPDRPEPSCVFDRDCARGVCRLGSCRESGR
jgi:hypothetical protein